MSFVIGIDIGGTFTDAVAADGRGTLTGTKTPSTPPDFAQGIFDVLNELAASLGLTREELLRQTTYISRDDRSTQCAAYGRRGESRDSSPPRGTRILLSS